MPSSWSRSPDPALEHEPGLTQRRFVEASRRAEIIALVNSARSDREVARATVDELAEAFEAEVAFVVVSRPERRERATIGSMGLTAEQAAAVAHDPLVGDALGAARSGTHRGVDVLGIAAARRVALAPWTAENGRQVLVGVARFYDEAFDEAELALLEAVTTSVGHALERTWLGTERDRHAARQAALAHAARALSASLVGREVLEALSSELTQALDADVVVVYGAGPSGGLEAVAGTGLPPGGLPAGVDPPSLVQAARTGEPPVWQPAPDGAGVSLPGVAPLRAGLAAAIRAHDGMEGVVLAGYRDDRWVEREDVELLAAFTDFAGLAWRNAADHAAAQRAASLDSLTGCLNHGAFQDRLREEMARAERSRGSLALVLMDLNEFKAVNDTHGHLVGDALLRGVADALRAAVRPYDPVARYGGDEFALLLPSTDEECARRVVDRSLAAVAAVRLVEQIPVSGSAGLAHWRTGEEADAFIARADRSLLEAKRARGRGRTGGRRGDGPPSPLAEQREGQRLRRLATAGSLGTRLARLLDQRAIAETAIIELGAALGYDRCTLVRCEQGGAVTVVATAQAEDASAAPTEGSGDEGGGDGRAGEVSGALRRVLRERRTVLFARTNGAEGRSSELAVPVYVGGSLWGALGVRSPEQTPFGDDDAQLVQSVADHLGAALRTAELYEQLDQTHLGTAAALAAALEAKDHYTADHARSIADLAVAVGRELDVDDKGLRDLRYGAIFHDIGKIAIPDAILKKPGPLTEDELEVVRRHPAVGEQILAPVPFLSGVRQIVRHDHERWDGDGYPDGLRGDEIPLGARVVLVVDAYHAMRSDRPYRRAMPVEDAREELQRNAGTQFDPRVVEALLAVLARDPVLEPA